MNVFWVSRHHDYGGYGAHLTEAFPKYAPNVSFRSTRMLEGFTQYGRDVPWEQAARYWREADVVHLLDDFDAQTMLDVPDRPFVIRYAGTWFRQNPEAKLRQQRAKNAIGLVATIDLLRYAPDELEWAPFIRDLSRLFAIRLAAPRPDDGILRVCHSPTNRDRKHTKEFLAAYEKLAKEVECELILIEGQSYEETLRQKARADIFYDQATVGYGNNAVEAWAMGIPVIAGADDWTLNEMQRRFPIPFVQTTPSTILDALRILADPIKRQAWAEEGYDHAQQFHHPKRIVEQLRGIYRRAFEGAA